MKLTMKYSFKAINAENVEKIVMNWMSALTKKVANMSKKKMYS